MNATLFDRATPDTRKALEDAVEAHLAETGMTPSAFGRTALDNYPSFVVRLRGGADIRVDTADRVLAWLGLAPIGPRFRAGLDACIAATGTKPYLLGEQALGDPSFVTRLLGGCSAMLSTVDAVRDWVVADADEAALRAMEDAAAKAADAAKPTAGERTDMNEPMINTEAAGEYLGLSPRTLDTYRWAGTGPDYYKMGRRVCYLRRDLDAWTDARRRRSTSDDGGRDERAGHRPRGRRPRDGAPAKPGDPSSGKDGGRPEA